MGKTMVFDERASDMHGWDPSQGDQDGDSHEWSRSQADASSDGCTSLIKQSNVLMIGKHDALSLRAESHTRPFREKQGALIVSPSISRSNLTSIPPVVRRDFDWTDCWKRKFAIRAKSCSNVIGTPPLWQHDDQCRLHRIPWHLRNSSAAIRQGRRALTTSSWKWGANHVLRQCLRKHNSNWEPIAQRWTSLQMNSRSITRAWSNSNNQSSKPWKLKQSQISVEN